MPEQALFTNESEPPAGFDLFWAAYPRKVARKAALKAFSKLKPSKVRLNELLDALEKQKQNWKDPAFIPHAATWLNGERWMDELVSGPKYGGTKTMAERMKEIE